jgi:hypothetical protein
MKNLFAWAVMCCLLLSFAFGQSANLLKKVSPKSISADAFSDAKLDDLDGAWAFLKANKPADVLISDDLTRQTVVFIHHPFETGTTDRNETAKEGEGKVVIKEEDGEKVATLEISLSISFDQEKEALIQILHQEEADGEVTWSSYLLGKQPIWIAYLGPERELPPSIQVAIEQLDTRLESSFKGFLTLLKAATGGNELAEGKKSPKGPYLHFVRVDPTKFDAPAKIEITASSAEDAEPMVIEVHEKPWLEFRAGWSLSKIDPKLFSLENDTLSIVLDSSAKADFRQSLILGLELHLPRDVDRMQPIWKKQDMIFERFGVFGGVRVVKDFDLRGFFLGGSFALTRDFAFTMGATWQRDFAEQETAAPGISSLKEAQSNAEVEMKKAELFFGVTMAPSEMIKRLGLK